MKDKISIIVPVYNVENYLQRCVDSLINQTYENIEILLVDDGSSDRSGDICDYYAQNDKRVRVIHQQNMGQSVARNNAMAQAEGDFFCFVDSDDYVDTKYLEKMYQISADTQSDMVMCDFTMFTGERVDENELTAVGQGGVFNNIELIKNMHTVSGEMYVVLWGKLFRRELVEGITFPEGRICEDLAVLYKIYDRVNKASYISDVMYYYFRNNVNSSTFEIKERFYEDVFYALSNEINYMEKEHKELACYPMKTYMYWCFDYYRRLRGDKSERAKRLKKDLLVKYRKLYKSSKSLKKEKFYTFFYYLPDIYLMIKAS